MKNTKNKVLSLVAAATMLVITALVLLLSQVNYLNVTVVKTGKPDRSEVRLMNDVTGESRVVMGESSQSTK